MIRVSFTDLTLARDIITDEDLMIQSVNCTPQYTHTHLEHPFIPSSNDNQVCNQEIPEVVKTEF